MDEGVFVLDPPTFGLNMDLEADMSSADDLLYYLTDGQGQIMDTTGAFDAAHLLSFDDLASTHNDALAVHSSFSSSPSSSSPASSPPSVSSSYSFSSSPVSSPSSTTYSNSSSSEASPANSQSAGSSSDDGDHFVFGTWLESALDTTTISPAQLQMSSTGASTTMLEIQPLSTLPQLEILPPSASEDSDASESKPQAAKKDTRKRKRTKKNGDDAPPQTAVTLPRDELLKLSSQELEDYAENLRKVRKLTAEEEKDLRRQRRLIKNRESAQLSRVRRREHIEVIEQQLHEVQAENARLKLQVESLTTENLQLKQHIASSSVTTTLVPASPPLSTNVSADASTAAAVAAGEQVSASLINMVQGWTTLGKGATANAVKATYLFVILLSIGLFFNARFVHYGPGLGPLEMGPRPIMPQPFVYQPASNIEAIHTESIKQSAAGHAPLKPGRRLLQHDEPASHHYQEKRNNVELDNFAAGSLRKKAFMNSWQKETATETQFPIDNSENTMPQAMTGEAANKTILMCPSLTPLHWPGQEMSAHADEITFILPASSATYIPSSRMVVPSSSSSTFSASARHTSGSMVQLTCKIVDARMASLDTLLVQ